MCIYIYIYLSLSLISTVGPADFKGLPLSVDPMLKIYVKIYLHKYFNQS